ncbi:UPF0561 protein C2orf68 homolog [Nematostella vectensis]|uniref:UPF0561 protein C2orf68 homolog n=1 Tax=Nematostella vectensis TaxID=45351 RepID=UPI0020777F42|nr:UPF0561 protein C2orf68 homolog [Nematostella vectensis]
MAGDANFTRETVPKLDTSHGFVHSIIKNQIDRDEYDKEQRVLAMQKEEAKRQRRERRAALQVYVPPHQRKRALGAFEEESTDSPCRPLLEVEFEAKDGSILYLTLNKGEDLKEAVKRFAVQANLENHLREALYQRLLNEVKDL